MQPAERLIEVAAEIVRRNDVTRGRQPFAIEITPWAIVIRLRPAPAVLTDPDPRPFPVAPAPPISYMAGNRWHTAPDSNPWNRHHEHCH